MFKKTISLILVFMMILTIGTPMNSYGVAKDYAGHWAEDTIQLWLDEGYITGYPDGSFNPEGKVTRSEFVTMVNSVFNYTEVADTNFTDVESNKWYYQEVQKAFKANYIAGTSETQFAPNENLTREQAAVIVSKIMKLDANPLGVEKFKDNNKISIWAKAFVGAAAQAGLINGYNDNTFKPQNPISRAEAIIILNNSLKGSQSADLIIDKAGTVVENKTFRNIHITDKVGNGEVTLKNVTITGELLVEGGGLNSIIIEDSIVNKLTTNKADGKVRILLIGETAVDVTSIESGATLEQRQLTGTGFSQVIVDEDANESQVLTVSADIGNLTVKAKIKVNVKTGTIESIEIEKTAEGASVNLAKDATVLLVTIDVNAAFTGTGTIVSASINVNNVTFEQEPKKTDLAPGVSKPTVQPPLSGGGGGGGSGPSTIAVSVITVTSVGNLTTVVNGRTLQMSAAVTPANATNPTISWSVATLAGGTASIDATTGLLKATGVGTVRVTATNTASGVTGTKDIKVTAKGTIEKSKGPDGEEATGLTYVINDQRITFNGVIPYYPIGTGGFINNAGNYIGVKLTAPEGIVPDENATLTFGGNLLSTGWDKFKDGDNFFYFYKMVRDNTEIYTIEIKWNNLLTETYLIDFESTTTLELADTPAPVVEKVALESATATMNAKVYTDYTAASWLTLELAKTAIGKMPEATQAEVDAKTAAINAAVAALVANDKVAAIVSEVNLSVTAQYGLALNFEINEEINFDERANIKISYFTKNGETLTPISNTLAGDAPLVKDKTWGGYLWSGTQENPVKYSKGSDSPTLSNQIPADITLYTLVKRGFVSDGSMDYTEIIDWTVPAFYKVKIEVVDNDGNVSEVKEAGYLVERPEPTIVAFGNEFEIGTYDEFLTGEFDNNTALVSDIGDGALTLKAVDGKYPTNGVYISQIIDVPNFEYMVASWNSDTPEGTYVEIQAKVLVNHFDENNKPIQTWTEWLSWGQWSPFIVRASKSTSGKLAKTSVDELIVKGSDGETASKVQMKAILHTDNPLVTPTVRYLHGTLKNTINPISKEFKETIDVTNLNKNIKTPAYSQMIRCPRIKSSICSATTITMIMNRFGEKLLPEEVAQNTYDNKYGWGNWAFAVASTGSYGYKSYVDYTTIEGLKREIAKGYPVGVSVKYSDILDPENPPYVEGSPGVTWGHLIVVTGFETTNGVEYVLVNDSYAPDNETVSRKYKLDQFEEAWDNRVAYIVNVKVVNSGSDHTMRIDAKLVDTDVANEYKVYVNDLNVNVQNFGGTIAYTVDDDLTYKYFPKITDKNSLTFTWEDINNSKLKVYVITDTGKIYITSTVLSEAAKANLLAVAEAKEAVVGGSVDVTFGSDQTAKTAAVLNYVNGLIKNEVTAVVSFVSDNDYKVVLTKGSASDNKTITMVVNIAAAPNEDQLAPTGLAGVATTSALNDGKITGTTIAMEYKLTTDDDSRYTACSATETTVESAGDYLVRFAAKTGFNPGVTVEVKVPAYVEDTKTLLSIGSINGKAQVGVALTPGLVLPIDATYSFQWKISSAVDGTYTDITGATTNIYTPVAEDVGKFIKVSATGAGSSGYTGTVTSVATEAVAPVDAEPVDKTGLESATATMNAKVYTDYTAVSWLTLELAKTAIGRMPEATQAEVDAKTAAINAAVAALVEDDKKAAIISEVKLSVSEQYGLALNFNINEEINFDERANVKISYFTKNGDTLTPIKNTKTNADLVKNKTWDGYLWSGTEASPVKYSKGTDANSTFLNIIPTDTTLYTLVKSGLASDGSMNYTEITDWTKPATYVVKIEVTDNDGNVNDVTTIEVKVESQDPVLPESLTSNAITNFNFETLYGTQARAVSKPFSTSYFKDSTPKSFTITDRYGNVIPIDMNVNIPLNEYTSTSAAAVGSYVESIIQMWFQDKYGLTDWVSKMTVSASYDNDKLVISTFEPGASAFVQIGGSNWSDYYNNSEKIYGTGDDTSYNRTFTISDGTNTATIALEYSYTDMYELVSDIDYMLSQNHVSATAEKVDESHFKLIAKTSGIHLTIGGTNKADFFNSFVSK